MAEYQCPLSISGMCCHGGNKHYDYGFFSGSAIYCRMHKHWVSDMKECPDQPETLEDVRKDPER